MDVYYSEVRELGKSEKFNTRRVGKTTKSHKYYDLYEVTQLRSNTDVWLFISYLLVLFLLLI